MDLPILKPAIRKNNSGELTTVKEPKMKLKNKKPKSNKIKKEDKSNSGFISAWEDSSSLKEITGPEGVLLKAAVSAFNKANNVKALHRELLSSLPTPAAKKAASEVLLSHVQDLVETKAGKLAAKIDRTVAKAMSAEKDGKVPREVVTESKEFIIELINSK